MDPNETLRRLRQMAATAIEVDSSESTNVAAVDLTEMAEHFQALDQWIQNGGFLPANWQPVKYVDAVCPQCGEKFQLPAGTTMTRGSRPCGWSH